MSRICLALLLCLSMGLSACAPLSSFSVGLQALSPTDPSTAAATATSTPPFTPSPTPTATVTPTATPLGCLTQPGTVQSGEIDQVNPPQLFLIYLPPCYSQQTDESYPVLYLLHGQTSIDDQWVRMGAPQDADALIHSGQAGPFIMVFPDDRYWNLPPGPAFGDRLIHLIVPYVDSHYRTIPDAPHRALGGLSRGGGWAIHMLLTEYTMFGTVGLHSPVIFDADNAVLDQLMSAVPVSSWPRIWMDSGDRDGGIGPTRRFEALLTDYGVPHEWHLYTGEHTEPYWSAHLTEYLTWYTQQFDASDLPTSTALPAAASTATQPAPTATSTALPPASLTPTP